MTVVLPMDVDFEFTVTRLAKIANTNNLSAYREYLALKMVVTFRPLQT
jgi:hypothetical protein